MRRGARFGLALPSDAATGVWRPVLRRKVPVQVDVANVASRPALEAVGIGDGNDEDRASLENLGLVLEMLDQLLEKWSTQRLVAMDHTREEVPIRTVAEDDASDGSTFDRVAEILVAYSDGRIEARAAAAR